MSGTKKVTIPVSIGYGLTDIMGGGAFTVIGAWLLFFYTTFVGLTPVEAASIVAIARIVDAIVSLFMGSFTDHFYKNYFGKKIWPPPILFINWCALDAGLRPVMGKRHELLVLLVGVFGIRNHRRDGAHSMGNATVGNDQRI
ncbi:hypothetical protein OS31_38940 [Dickeya oryzae]